MNEATVYPNLLALLTDLADTEYPTVHLTMPVQSDWEFRVYPAAWGTREIGVCSNEGWVHAGHASPR